MTGHAAFDPDDFVLRLSVAISGHGSVCAAACACGVPLATFEAAFYRANTTSAATLAALARGLGVSADWLLFGDATPTHPALQED